MLDDLCLQAYRRTALSNWRGVPLYLQWAPLAVFLRPFEPVAKQEVEEEKLEVKDEELDAEPGACSVFVKNLAFATTEDDLRKQVGSNGVRSVRIVQKNGQSLGYGFVEFASREAAVRVMKQVERRRFFSFLLTRAVCRSCKDSSSMDTCWSWRSARREEMTMERPKRRKRRRRSAQKKRRRKNRQRFVSNRFVWFICLFC